MNDLETLLYVELRDSLLEPLMTGRIVMTEKQE